MDGLGLALLVAKARLHAPRLERLEVRARGDLAVGVLSRQPNLEIVGLRGGKADVAGAQRHHAVGQLEPAQDRFGVRGKLFVRLVGFGWMHDLHQLDLVELVVADHAARVLARRAGLGAEARRPSATWTRAFGANSNLRGRPQRRSSRFASSLAPTGTDSWGRLGTRDRKSFSSATAFADSISAASALDFNLFPSSRRAFTSSPFALACPNSFAALLREASAASDADWISFRLASSARNFCKSNAPAPRVARRCAISSGFLRSNCMSIISFSPPPRRALATLRASRGFSPRGRDPRACTTAFSACRRAGSSRPPRTHPPRRARNGSPCRSRGPS